MGSVTDLFHEEVKWQMIIQRPVCIHGEMYFAHVVGYTVNGKSGLEAIYNNDLMTSNASISRITGGQ